jgi:tetratricopeptide (TPR) repeat protein
MKISLILFGSLCLVAAAYLCLPKGRTVPSPTPTATDLSQPKAGTWPSSPPPAVNAGEEPTNRVAPSLPETAAVTTRNPVLPPAPQPFQQALQTVLAPQAGFPAKQAAWNYLKDSGRMDQAIQELEQGAAANPNSADYPAALGQACLQKAGMLKDIREQGILGMKADQSFDAALSLDPANWDAAFWKATAMSYWPAQLGKGQEVIERFLGLVRQQEALPAQSHYAMTYAFLGDQYQKQGYNDYAQQIWQRGKNLFPEDPLLQDRLSKAAAAQQTAAR